MRSLIPLAAVLLAGGCTVPQQASDQALTIITRIADTGIGDLNTSKTYALALTPPDNNQATCADAAIKVAKNIQAPAAAIIGKPVGAFTVTEIATVWAPHSPQVEEATNDLLAGCIAKIRTVKGSAAATVGDVAMVLPLVPLTAAAAAALP